MLPTTESTKLQWREEGHDHLQIASMTSSIRRQVTKTMQKERIHVRRIEGLQIVAIVIVVRERRRRRRRRSLGPWNSCLRKSGFKEAFIHSFSAGPSLDRRGRRGYIAEEDHELDPNIIAKPDSFPWQPTAITPSLSNSLSLTHTHKTTTINNN